jgi:hypothetical protein
VPERRTGQVGQSVADAVAGRKSSEEKTSYASRETRKPRRTSSSTYQAMVIVLAGIIVLLGLVIALTIAHYAW